MFVSRRCGLSLRLLLLMAAAVISSRGVRGVPQEQKPPQTTAPAPNQTPQDYSKEPFVIEEMRYRVRFENDGTGQTEANLRIRVQSDVGVQQLGQLVLNYNSENQHLAIGYVRVRKADGTVVTAAADAVQDLSAPIAREAPMYTDLRQKHVTVPSLEPGSTLEYGATITTHTPLAPGQFWFEYSFEKNVITLDEELELNLPRARAVKIKTQPGFEPRSTDEGDRRIYRWSSSNRKRASDEEASAKKKRSREPEPPSVQLTTFESWEQVGRWYGALVKERAVTSPEVREKAQDLTRNLKSPTEKLEALYDYVAKSLRYVSLSFGAGRYQPHAAPEVLANKYGDCKDKHTLLAALALAAGLQVYPALIPSQRKVDSEVPSPAHFDHVISVAPVAGEMLWMDTTAEVAPFRMLRKILRKKLALVIPADAPASLIETPADPPFASTQEVEVEAALSDLGRLAAQVHYTLRGDNELLLRMAFRNTPQTQWQQLGQVIATTDGLRGEVKEVKPGDPAATHEPFRLEFTVSVPNFADWSSKRLQLAPPLPGFGLPDAGEDVEESTEPFDLGSPQSITMRARLMLPERYTARLPVTVSVARDYAEYRSRYSIDGHTLVVERTLRFLLTKLPPERARDYALFFRRAVERDQEQTFTLESTLAGAPAIPESATAEELVQAAAGAIGNSNFTMAATLLERVVEKEPKNKKAWKMLGTVRLAQQEYDKAAEAFRKQAEVNPYDDFAYQGLGLAYLAQQKYAAGVEAFRKQLEVNPLDSRAQASLGIALRQWKKYAEAAPELEKAISLDADNAALYVSLGDCYLNLDQAAKAQAAYDKAVELAPSPPTWNNIAYELTVRGVNLDRAQQYAESAVAATSAELRNVALERLQLDDLRRTSAIANYWDTLGWIFFQRGDLDRAEKLVEASWRLDFHGEVGDHLAQIYEKRGRRQDALRTYALAMAATRPVPETRGRLAALAGGDGKVDALVGKAIDTLAELKTLRLGKLMTDKQSSQAQFFILLGPGPRVEAVKFVSGSEKLRAMGERLRELDYGLVFPDETPTRLVRRGTLSCPAGTGECLFVLVPAETVTSVN